MCWYERTTEGTEEVVSIYMLPREEEAGGTEGGLFEAGEEEDRSIFISLTPHLTLSP